MKRFLLITLAVLFCFSTQVYAAVELDADANGLVDVSKGGLNALPTADTQLLQATGVGTFGWAAVIDDTKGNGHTEYLWSADKVFDQVALKVNLTALDDSKGNGDTTYFWSADKAFDQLALKVNLTALDDTKGNGDTAYFYSADKVFDLLALKQDLDTDLTTWAGVTPSANGQSLVSAADYAAMKALLDLEAGTDFNAYDADLADLADGVLAATKVGGAKVTTASKAANYTIGADSADEAYGGTVYVTSAATITAPAVAAGMSFRVVTIGAIAVSLDVNSADRMYLNGTALADGDKATNNSTTGDSLMCQYESAAGWYCWAVAGTWTDGN